MSRVDKLPVWAREMIQGLKRERDRATEALRRFTDFQNPTNFYSEQMRGREVIRQYYQSDSVTCEEGDLRVEMTPKDGAIHVIAYYHGLKRLAIIPSSSNSFRLEAIPS